MIADLKRQKRARKDVNRICLDSAQNYLFGKKKDRVNPLRIEKAVAISVWAPTGAVRTCLHSSSSGFKGVYLEASPHLVPKCEMSRYVYEQGSHIDAPGASPLGEGYAGATFHCIGHFATGCPKLGGSHWLPVLDTPTRLLDAHFLAFGHAFMCACEHAPCLCCRVSMALLLELPTHRAAVFLQICPNP